MTDPIIEPADLTPFAAIDHAKAQAMIEDAVALAIRVAPCVGDDLDSDDRAAVKAVLRGAILRWNESGTGALSGWQQAAGSFQISQTLDSRQPSRTLLWPSEITQLQTICRTTSGGAFDIDTIPHSSWPHVTSCPALTGGPCRCGGILIA